MLSGPNSQPLFLPLMKSLKPSSRAALVKAVSDGSARESTMSPKRSEDVPCGSGAAVVANREAESTDAPERGGLLRSSDEAGVMPVERRERVTDVAAPGGT